MTYFGLQMEESEFENLHHTSMKWGNDWEKQKNRFDPTSSSFKWKMAYWSDNFSDVLIEREWLRAREETFELVFDNATDSYLLLTNYLTEGWKK